MSSKGAYALIGVQHSSMGGMYDLPVEEDLACFVAVAGLLTLLKEAAESDDPMALPSYQGGPIGLHGKLH
jgi:hypothetical protein